MQSEKYPVDEILSNLKIEALNEMQIASIDVLERHDELVLLSSTGSGKTLAFLLPLLKDVDPAKTETSAMIIVPSRELALQIEHVVKSMKTGLK